MSAESDDKRRRRVLAPLDGGKPPGRLRRSLDQLVGELTSEETTAMSAHLLENLTLDEVLDALMVALSTVDRDELIEALGAMRGV